ncbi:MAG: hypothetical protein ABI151_17330, partial [Chitinophagaceae bacterium]
MQELMKLVNGRSMINTRLVLIISIFSLSYLSLDAQVNTVEFGKNGVQFKKFKWDYIQTSN